MKRAQLSIYYIQELNYRLGYTVAGSVAFFLATYNYKQALVFILLPKGFSHFISTELTEIFFTYIQLCTTTSAGLAVLLAALQIYLFFRPGLYTYEAETLLSLLVSTFVFYVFIYIFLFPFILKVLWEIFLLDSQNFTAIHLSFEPRLTNYVKHIRQLNQTVAMILPCLIGLAALQKYTDRKNWTKYRSISYVVAFAVAAFMTPPDILSQLLVGIPLVALYEMQIAFWALRENYQDQLLIRQPLKRHQNPLRNKKQCKT